ncbi:hypothetical protein ZIOFF_061685 [Zingiber officinale]|uniref:Uncharacterized protein n=1 Tax=Zingiber officinale TaxID=94328 RepID=A0A8J5EZH3_ZINOF|nr:hypothetical protein ZIOFF_061685 [Zingiber officinale]
MRRQERRWVVIVEAMRGRRRQCLDADDPEGGDHMKRLWTQSNARKKKKGGGAAWRGWQRAGQGKVALLTLERAGGDRGKLWHMEATGEREMQRVEADGEGEMRRMEAAGEGEMQRWRRESGVVVAKKEGDDSEVVVIGGRRSRMDAREGDEASFLVCGGGRSSCWREVRERVKAEGGGSPAMTVAVSSPLRAAIHYTSTSHQEINSEFSNSPLRLQYFIVATDIVYFIFVHFVPTMSAMRNWLATSPILMVVYEVILVAILVKDGTFFLLSARSLSHTMLDMI